MDPSSSKHEDGIKRKDPVDEAAEFLSSFQAELQVAIVSFIMNVYKVGGGRLQESFCTNLSVIT